MIRSHRFSQVWRAWPAIALALLLALWARPVAAIETIEGDQASVQAGQTIDDDVFLAGETVTIAGHVTGDVFAFGNTVAVLPGAQIDGDLFAGAGLVVVDGTINGSVRSGSRSLTLNGVVGRNVLAAGSQLTLSSSGAVKGNWIGAGADVLVNGPIDGNFTAGAQTVQLLGTIGGNAQTSGQTLTIAPTARIGGNLTYTTAVDQAPPAGVVQGNVQYIAPPRDESQAAPSGPSVDIFSLIMLAGAMIVGLLLARLTPGLYQSGQRMVAERGLLTFGVGILALIVVPIVAVLLMVTLIGLPLGLLSLVGYLASLYIGWIVAAVAVAGVVAGMIARERRVGLVWLVLGGLLVLYLLTLIPILGGIVNFVMLCLGLGILALLVIDRLRGQPAAPAVPAPVPAA